MIGLELYLNAYFELVAFMREGSLAFETLIAYADEYGYKGEQRLDLFAHIAEMLRTQNEIVANKLERERRLAALKGKRKSGKGK